MWCECTSVIILSCAQPHPRAVTRKRRPPAKAPLQFSPSISIAAVLSEHRACAQPCPLSKLTSRTSGRQNSQPRARLRQASGLSA
jgi:hypothetical protein